MAHAKTESATLDSKGRLLIPEATRKTMDLVAGDVIFILSNPETGAIQLAKAINPLEQMALDAIAEDDAGLTVSLEEAWAMIDEGIE